MGDTSINITKTEFEKLQSRIIELELELAESKEKSNRFVNAKNTVKVPEQFQTTFDKAEETVKDYFKNIDFNPSEGIITINDDRYVLIRASALSYDFFNVIKQMYADEEDGEAINIGQNFLFDIGHVIGIEDAKQFHAKMKLNDPIEKLAAGPVHFAYCGWASVEILPESTPSPDENFYLKYKHPYSFEADSWMKKGRKSEMPVCIMNAAYSSGWCEQSFGIKLTAVEISCKAKGDKDCTFIMAPPDKIINYLTDSTTKETKLDKIPVFFERKTIEREMKKSLEEKEILLKEIHHRVKNNLQIITSFLNLQFKDFEDKKLIDAISKTKNRIIAMSLIHTQLYQNKDLGLIDFESYVHKLTSSISEGYSLNDKIGYSVNTSDCVFDIDVSINLGLIITELFINSYKHAFLGKNHGHISVSLTNLSKGKFQLVVEDNGVGMSEEFDMEKPKTLGLEIVIALTNQINGTIERSSKDGLSYMINFEN
jgi:two-component sensor histidine kinase/predicted hydrocarbon binding protein